MGRYRFIPTPISSGLPLPILIILCLPWVAERLDPRVSAWAWFGIKAFAVIHPLEVLLIHVPLCIWAKTPLDESVRRLGYYTSHVAKPTQMWVQIKWCVQTLILGFPSWVDFLSIARKNQKARKQ